MTVPVETAPVTIDAPEVVNRRTDDVLFNVRYLARNVLDRELGLFLPEVEQDVFEQDLTDIAESDVHKLGAVVQQTFDPESGQYFSLGVGTVDNARKGLEALDPEDGKIEFEWGVREQDVVAEQNILRPEVNEAMRAGAVLVQIHPAPTHHEMDPDVVVSLGYDGRTMFGLQWLSPDGQTKTMQTFSVFNTPANAWADFLAERYDTTVESTSLGVRKFSNQVLLESGTADEILGTFIGGVAEHVSTEDTDSVLRQLDGFHHEQADLTEQAAFYAREKLAFQKEVALSLNGWARPKVTQTIKDVMGNLNPTKQQELAERFYGDNLYVDEYVADLAVRIKTVTIDNRAGLATLNEHTVLRVASRIGLEAALEMAVREQAIQESADTGDFMSRRNEQLLAESGASCGGSCSVAEVDLFSPDAQDARQAGLKGKLYMSEELNESSKCSCKENGKKASVIVDGKNVVCTTCKEFKVNGVRGSLKKAA
jgi:hypothetical protein